MFYIKNTIFLQFTPRQKSALLSFIKSFVKKNKNLTKEDIIDKFIEEENYYFEINNPHFEFIIDYLSDEDFIKDLRTYIDSIFYELEQKEKMQFLIDKEKKYQKEQRKKANDYKMSKLKPTKKQLIYYEKIARAHNIKPKDTNTKGIIIEYQCPCQFPFPKIILLKGIKITIANKQGIDLKILTIIPNIILTYLLGFKPFFDVIESKIPKGRPII